MASRVITSGFSAATGGFLGLVGGGLLGQFFSRSSHSGEQATATQAIGVVGGMLIGAFTGAALVASSQETGTGVAGLPAGVGKTPPGLGAAPHRCTEKSAAKIAAQIPTGNAGMRWSYQHSVPNGEGLGFATTSKVVEVTTGGGRKRIHAHFADHVGMGVMSITCPVSGTRYVFAKTTSRL